MLISPALAALTADPGGPYQGLVGVQVQFDGTGSANTNGKIDKYQWDFGDGGSGKGATPNHSYRSAGVYVVSLTVTGKGENSSASTTATIVDPATTTTTTTLPDPTTTSSTPGTTTTTTTTTTTIPWDPTTTTTIPWDPTTTTTIPWDPTTTTTTTTIPPNPTTTSSTLGRTTTSITTMPTTTITTLEVLGQRIEAAAAAINVSATAFTVAPLAWAPGDEITVTMQLDAMFPGYSTVLLLLDGNRLGEPATVTTGTESTLSRQLPADLSVGPHRIELVTEEDPSQVLASRTAGVAVTLGALSPPLELGVPGSPAPDESNIPLLSAIGVLAIGGAAAGAWRYRRRWLPRRTRT